MSLINKMLRDLDERHATGIEPLPGEVRALSEQKTLLHLGRGGWVLLGGIVFAIIGFVTSTHWLPVLLNVLPPSTSVSAPAPASVVALAPAPALAPTSAPGPAQTTEPASASTPTPVAAVRSEPRIPDELVPTLPSLTRALPLVPPARSESSAGHKKTSRTPPETNLFGLKVDPFLTKMQKRSAVSIAEDKLNAAPGGQSKPDSSSPVISKEQRLGGAERGAEHYRKAVIALKQGRAGEASVQLNSALQENPRHLAARQTMLSMLVEQKRWDEALALLSAGLDLMPEQSSWAMALARIQVERGNTAQAWETLQKYQSYAEQNADYHGFAGVLLQYLHKPREASLRYQEALQLKPGEGRWWYGLGSALEADNHATEAIDAYKHARTAGGLTPAMAEAIEKKLR